MALVFTVGRVYARLVQAKIQLLQVILGSNTQVEMVIIEKVGQFLELQIVDDGMRTAVVLLGRFGSDADPHVFWICPAQRVGLWAGSDMFRMCRPLTMGDGPSFSVCIYCCRPSCTAVRLL